MLFVAICGTRQKLVWEKGFSSSRHSLYPCSIITPLSFSHWQRSKQNLLCSDCQFETSATSSSPGKWRRRNKFKHQLKRSNSIFRYRKYPAFFIFSLLKSEVKDTNHWLECDFGVKALVKQRSFARFWEESGATWWERSPSSGRGQWCRGMTIWKGHWSNKKALINPGATCQ